MNYAFPKMDILVACAAFALGGIAACKSDVPLVIGVAGSAAISGSSGSTGSAPNGTPTPAPGLPTPDLDPDTMPDVPGGVGGTSGGEPIGAAGGTPIESDASVPPEEPPGEGNGSELRSGPSPGCSNGALPAVSGRVTLSVGSSERSFELRVPKGRSEPRALVLAMHGYLLNAAEHERITGLSEVAEREGFVVAYPEGIGSPPSWNAGSCCAFDDPQRDDLGFLAELIDYLGERLCLDQGRVYATGFSNGGMLVYRMACEMADRIAAVASVAGSAVVPLNECAPVRPVPLMHTHGTADPIVPYAGGPGPTWLTPAGETPPNFPSAEQEVARFAALDGCTSSTETVFSERDTECVRQAVCEDQAEVMLCTVRNGGHTWPGGASMGLLASVVTGPQSATLPTSDMIWEFLKAHHMP